MTSIDFTTKDLDYLTGMREYFAERIADRLVEGKEQDAWELDLYRAISAEIERRRTDIDSLLCQRFDERLNPGDPQPTEGEARKGTALYKCPCGLRMAGPDLYDAIREHEEFCEEYP